MFIIEDLCGRRGAYEASGVSGGRLLGHSFGVGHMGDSVVLGSITRSHYMYMGITTSSLNME
jgi:hypothetical protein